MTIGDIFGAGQPTILTFNFFGLPDVSVQLNFFAEACRPLGSGSIGSSRSASLILNENRVAPWVARVQSI